MLEAPQATLTAERLADLQEAWAELAQGAQGSGFTTFRACTRNGSSWEENADAVRGLAATLRDVRQ